MASTLGISGDSVMKKYISIVLFNLLYMVTPITASDDRLPETTIKVRRNGNSFIVEISGQTGPTNISCVLWKKGEEGKVLANLVLETDSNEGTLEWDSGIRELDDTRVRDVTCVVKKHTEKSFEDSFNNSYTLTKGPPLRRISKKPFTLRGEILWKAKSNEFIFTEPTVGLINVMRSWKRVPEKPKTKKK